MASKAVPILILGGTEAVGGKVIAGLKPQYEVIHFSLVEAANKEVPLLLKGEVPSSPSSKLGSGNWSTFPKAILLGGAYQDDTVAELRRLTAETSGTKRIPWLRVDNTKPSAPPGGPEYAGQIVNRAKDMLRQLEEEGKFAAEDDTVYFF